MTSRGQRQSFLLSEPVLAEAMHLLARFSRAHDGRTPIHPGEHLADELKALGMSAAASPSDINVPVHRITGIINGTRAHRRRRDPAWGNP